MFSDKRKAVKHLYRIKEMTLFKMALLGGAIGGFLGMFLFRHKSRKVKFYVIYSLALVAHAGLLYFIFVINK